MSAAEYAVKTECVLILLQVHWPVNLIVTENSMKTYQLIFRHLFELKCVERELSKVWKIFQRARPIPR